MDSRRFPRTTNLFSAPREWEQGSKWNDIRVEYQGVDLGAGWAAQNVRTTNRNWLITWCVLVAAPKIIPVPQTVISCSFASMRLRNYYQEYIILRLNTPSHEQETRMRYCSIFNTNIVCVIMCAVCMYVSNYSARSNKACIHLLFRTFKIYVHSLYISSPFTLYLSTSVWKSVPDILYCGNKKLIYTTCMYCNRDPPFEGREIEYTYIIASWDPSLEVRGPTRDMGS